MIQNQHFLAACLMAVTLLRAPAGFSEDKPRGAPDEIQRLGQIAAEHFSHGHASQAESEYRNAVRVSTRLLGAAAPETLNLRFEFALVLEGLLKYTDAEAEHRAVLELREKILGRDHVATLESRYQVALCLGHQRRHEEAEAAFRALLPVQERVLGAGHRATLTTCYRLAQCLMSQGRTAEALPFAQRAHDGAVRVLGEGSPEAQAYDSLLRQLGSPES